MGIALALGLIGSLVSAFVGFKSMEKQQQVNDANVQAQKEINTQNIEFAQKENEITRQREDTAHQREVEDLKAAGLSPIANLGGAKSSTGIVPTLQAPIQDASGYIEGFRLMQGGMDGLGDIAKTIYQEDNANKRHEKMLDFEKNKTNQQLIQDWEKFSSTLAQNKERLTQEDHHFTKNMEHLSKLIEVDMTKFNDSQRQELTKMEIQSLYDTVGHVKVNYISDPKLYTEIRNKLFRELGDALANYDLSIDDISEFAGTSADASLGSDTRSGSSTRGKGLLGSAADMLGIKAGFDVDTKNSKSSSATGRIREELRKIIDSYQGYPVYAPKNSYAGIYNDSFRYK